MLAFSLRNYRCVKAFLKSNAVRAKSDKLFDNPIWHVFDFFILFKEVITITVQILN